MEQRLTRTATYVEPKMLTPEHIAKMKAGRLAYMEKKRAEKGLPPVPENTSLKGAIIDKTPLIPREEVIKQINKNKKEILQAQIEGAKGMFYSEDGKIVYTKNPNLSAGEYLLNQLIGKPVESLEVKQVTKLIMDI